LDSTNLSRDLNIKSDVSRRLNVPLLDLTPDLRPGGKSLYLEADPVHPNSEGNKIIAQRLWEMLEDRVSP